MRSLLVGGTACEIIGAVCLLVSFNERNENIMQQIASRLGCLIGVGWLMVGAVMLGARSIIRAVRPEWV